MYMYSERPGTPAAKKLTDDVPDDIKGRRLTEIIKVQNKMSLTKNAAQIGKIVDVLIEGNSKKSENDWMGRSDQNIVVVFPKGNQNKGEIVKVLVERATVTTLIGTSID
jgi:tRNA-2-methylthio-N6-dimethylallyladenosine synthase